MNSPSSPDTPPTGDPAERSADVVLANAVRVLTEAAHLTRPVLTRDEAASTDERPVWVDSGNREPADWAEFVTLALAGAAANIGGIELALRGRPGSWEADGVRNLLASTVGYDEKYLLEHRTEPVTVDLYVDVLMAELGVWATYDQASAALTARYDAIGLPTATSPEAAALLAPATDEQERQADAVADLEERLEAQRVADWTAYGEALSAAVHAAAAELFPDLRVPVVVRVDLDTYQPPSDRYDDLGVTPAGRLREVAVDRTPLPGGGRAPLDRLDDAAPTA